MANAVGAVIALREPSSTLRQGFLRAFGEINAQRRFVLLSPGTLCQHGFPPSLVCPGALRPPRGCPVRELLQAASRRVPTAQPGPKRMGSFWGMGQPPPAGGSPPGTTGAVPAARCRLCPTSPVLAPRVPRTGRAGQGARESPPRSEPFQPQRINFS